MILRRLLKLRNRLRGGIACYLAALLLLLPVWIEPHITWPSEVQDTLFVIDISESMNVRDSDDPVPQTLRLELAKAAAREAMTALACGSRVSLALFAGEDVVVLFEPLEICSHFPAIEQVVSRLSSRMRWIGDSRIEVGLTHAITEARSRNLNVVFITDGDEMPHRSAPRLTGLENFRGKSRGVVFCIGGDAPLPVPRLDADNQATGYWTREEAVREGYHPNLLALVDGLEAGQKAPEGMLDEVGEHMSVARPAYLESLAKAAGFDFRHIRHARDVTRIVRSPTLTHSAMAERDARWLFGLMAVFLVLAGWFWPWLTGQLWWKNTKRWFSANAPIHH